MDNTGNDLLTWNGILYCGAHEFRTRKRCALEAAALVSGERHTAFPRNVSKQFWSLVATWNDSFRGNNALRTKWLADFVYRLPGTKAGKHIEDRRNRMIASCVIRELLPILLDRRNAPELLADIYKLPTIKGPKSLGVCAEQVRALMRRRGAMYRDYEQSMVIGLGDGTTSDILQSLSHNMMHGHSNATCGDLIMMLKSRNRRNRQLCRLVDRIASDLIDRMIKLTEPQESQIRPGDNTCTKRGVAGCTAARTTSTKSVVA